MKMAVVGCEASGKTVFMGALADYFGRDAANNPMRLKLTPENAAANKFERLMFRQMRCQHQWPPATPPDRTVEIRWSLRQKGEPLASIDLLEFGGETFRAAFRDGTSEQHEGSVAELLKYFGDTDFFIVLVSIKALLLNPNAASEDEFERETEALWVTRGILDFIRKNRPNAGVVIGLTQADRYRNELGEAGSPRQLFAEHWPTVAAAMGDIPVVDVASVSKTDESGNPADGYRTHGILPVMRIFARHCFGSEDALEGGVVVTPKPASAPASVPEKVTASEPPRVDPLSTANALRSSASRAEKTDTETAVTVPPVAKKESSFVLPIILLLVILVGGALLLKNSRSTDAGQEPKTIEKIVEVQVTNTVEKVVEKNIEIPVTNTVEKLVEVQITNTVEKVVEKNIEVPVTNTVEKLVEVQVTNTVEKLITVPVTNTVEKLVEVQVTNTVEKIVTNVVEKIVKIPVTNTHALASAPVTTITAPTNAITPTYQPNQIPPGYRVWTDYNGRKIIAKWTGVSVDESGITIVSRYNRRIDAVLWKFSQEDQLYIKSEIKRHTDRGEIMQDGKWIRNPILKSR